MRKKSKLIFTAFFAWVSMTPCKVKSQVFIKEYDVDTYTGSTDSYEHFSQNFDLMGGNYVIGGGKTFSSEKDPIMFRIDPNGTVIGNAKRYPLSGSQRNVHVISIPSLSNVGNMGYLLCGITNTYESNFFIKTNNVGTVVWSKKITFTNANSLNLAMKIAMAKQAANQDIYIAGDLTLLNNDEIDNREVVVLKLDHTNGAVKWCKSFQISGSLTDLRVTGFLEGGDGRFHVYGESRNSSGSFILTFTENSSGIINTYSTKVINLKHGSQILNNNLYALLYSNGNFYCGGEVTHATSGSSSYIFKLNSSLNSPKSLADLSNSSSNYYGNKSSILTHLSLNNAGLLGTGVLTNGSSNVPFTLLLDSDGTPISSDVLSTEMRTPRTAIDCLVDLDNNGFVTLNQRANGNKKLRFSRYNVLAKTACEASGINASSSYGTSVEVSSPSTIMFSRSYESLNQGVTPSNIAMAPELICEQSCSASTPGPITTSTGSASFCAGDPFSLIAPTGYSAYLWLHNGNMIGNTSSVSISAGGSYVVFLTDVAGCVSQQSININMISGCEVSTAPSNISYCSLEPFNQTIGWETNPLAGCLGAYTFAWSYNGNSISDIDWNATFMGPGTYVVSAITPCGTQTYTITVSDQLMSFVGSYIALPNLISYPQPTFGAFYTPPAGYLYDWEVINLTTSAVFTGTSSTITIGSYNPDDYLQVTLTLLDPNHCATYSNTITWSKNSPKINFVSPAEFENETERKNNSISVSPNPTTGVFNIDLPTFDPETSNSVNVYNSLGERLIQFQLNANQSQIDLTGHENGIYILVYSNGVNSEVIRIAKTN
ncbi:MAG TPA: T9SS type A sorting domain-containing protein [Flavobacteriales bacterium]|nr:T9SS type A sorting domain-containing protein [Flavobacteriales bacterium]